MKTAKIMKINEKHFDYITNEIKEKYEKDPFEFLFIGSSGFYVKQIADELSKKTNKTLNRDAFRVINQYITELLLNYEPNSTYIDRDFLKVYIENEIGNLVKQFKNDDDEFSSYLQVISKSQKSTEYILNIFEKKWEISRVEQNQPQNEDILKYSELYRNIDDSIDPESNLIKLYKKIEKSLEDFLNQKFDNSKTFQKNFDPISVYKWFYNEFPEILKSERKEKLGKTLIISGFFDMTPIMAKVLKCLFSLFDDVYFYIWEDVMDRGFNSLTSVYEFLKDSDFEIKHNYMGINKLFKEKNISIYQTSDSISEMENISKEIKKKILYENLSPSDFAIITPDNSSANMFADYLNEIKVPYRFKNDIPLSQSRIVIKLLQPLKTVVRGYEVEDMMAMIETGYAGDSELTMEEIESYLRHLDLLYSEVKTSFAQRKASWFNALKEEKNKILSNYKQTEEKERYEKTLNELNSLEIVFNNLFDILKQVKDSDKNKEGFLINTYRQLIKDWIDKDIINLNIFSDDELNKNQSIISEYNALNYFEQFLLKTEESLEKILKKNKKKRIKLDEYFRIISDLTEIETYRDSERYHNTVEIMNLNDSRFIHKKYKYYINFSEDFYPLITINPFLSSMLDNGTKLAKTNEKVQRRNLLISMAFAENIIFSYPISTLGGKTILPSMYEKEFIKLFKITPKKLYSEKRQVLPQNADEIYSFNEALLYYLINDIKTNDDDLKNSKENIKEIKNHIKNTLWNSRNSISIKNISHNKISSYIDCPFKFYMSYIAGIKGDIDFSIFATGNLKHKIMEKLFKKYPDFSQMREKYFNEDELLEEIKKIANQEWDDTINKGLEKYEAIKVVEIEKISEELLVSIGHILNKYIEIRKNMELNYDKVIKTELRVDTDINIGKYKNINLTTRIDRLDITSGDYSYIGFEGKDSFLDELKQGTYSILDYKNGSSFQSEQLLIYYIGLIHSEEWKNKINDNIYLKFQPLTIKDNGPTKNMQNKFIKIQKNLAIIKQKGNSKNFIGFGLYEFYDWLEKTIDSISNSDFTPIAQRDRIHKRFLEEMQEKYNTYSNETYYECDKCQYKKICSIMQYLDNFKIKESWFTK